MYNGTHVRKEERVSVPNPFNAYTEMSFSPTIVSNTHIGQNKNKKRKISKISVS